MARALQHDVQGLRDFYDVLGVPRAATTEEIRRAYRSLALQFHPDRNSGSAEAEERFKELAEAFHTLSDADRRAVYDVWGPRAISHGVPNPFDGTGPDLDDAVSVFVQQFSAFVNELDGWEAERSAPQRVLLPLRVTVSLAEVATGTAKEIALHCSLCSGTGIGSIGSGESELCAACGGSGENQAGETVLVQVPAGVASGDCIRVHRATEGDMLAFVAVEEDPRFVRAGADVVVELPLSPRRGAGAEVEVPTPTGTTRVRIPKGTPLGGALRIPGLGLPARTRPGNGDLIVKLVAEEPEGRRSVQPAHGEAADASLTSGEPTRSVGTVAVTGVLAFLFGGASVGLVARARAGGDAALSLANVGVTVVLTLAVAGAFLFLVSSVLAFGESGILSRLADLRRTAASGRRAAVRAMERFERRLRRFAVHERRHPPRPLVVQLDRLAVAVERVGSGPISRLTQLERRFSDGAASLARIQPQNGWSPDQVAQRLRESARVTADSLVAAPLLLLAALALAGVDFWVLGQAIAPLLPPTEALPLPLSIIDPAGMIALLLAFGAVGSGVLRQALEPIELGAVERKGYPLVPIEPSAMRRGRPGGRKGYPLVLAMGPTLMAFVIVGLQTLCWLTLSRRVDLATRMELTPGGALATGVSLVLPAAGAVVTLLLVFLGYGFWLHVRQAFAADADGALARKLRRHSERRGAMDVQSLQVQVRELASVLEAFSKGIADEFVRTTGFDPGDQTIARSVRAAAARVSERGGVFLPRGIRSLEQVVGSLAVGAAGFGLLLALLGLLTGALSRAFATASPFAETSAWPLAAAGSLLFTMAGYLLRDALYGSNHATTLLVALPQRPARRLAAAVAGAALLIGLVFVAWLGAAGQPLDGGSGVRSIYLVLLSVGLAATASNLDGWIVAAYKVGYLVVNGFGWTALAVVGALLTAADGILAVGWQLVAVVSVPGRWVRAKAFRTT